MVQSIALTQMQILFLLVAISAGASLVLTGIVRTFALRHEVLDRPNRRSSHSIPTPRGGGVAVLLVSALGMTIGEVLGLVQSREALTLGCGMLLLGVIGWADDTRGVKPSVRLAVHVGIAFWTVYMLDGLPLVRVGNSSLVVGAVGYVLGTLGIVWNINLFNFMDGIDGLAGSQAVLIFGTIAVLLFLRGDYSLATIPAILAATSGGFLAWNWPPAKIFLGDVGSGAIGYLIAGLALASEKNQSVPLLAFAIIEGVFICDATVTLVRRVARGDRLTEAHRDHAYQRLTRAWGSHRSVTGWAAAITVLLAVLGAVGTMDQRLLLPALLFAFFLLGGLLFAVERRAPM
ncbi:MAG TPA: glycosyltransferase family 4 protein [Gemmatimonadaceae bacterium]